jgi:hypothetical protein
MSETYNEIYDRIQSHFEEERNTMNSNRDLHSTQAKTDFHAGRNQDCDEQNKACTKRITSVSSLILENHRLVDTADERLGLILCTLLEKIHGDSSCSGLVDSSNNLPTASIPLLDDMLECQENNNRLIERILEIIEKDL